MIKDSMIKDSMINSILREKNHGIKNYLKFKFDDEQIIVEYKID